MFTQRSLTIFTVPILMTPLVTGCSNSTEEMTVLAYLDFKTDKPHILALGSDGKALPLSPYGVCSFDQESRQIKTSVESSADFGFHKLEFTKVLSNPTDSPVAATLDGDKFEGHCSLAGSESERSLEGDVDTEAWDVHIQFNECQVTRDGKLGLINGDLRIWACNDVKPDE